MPPKNLSPAILMMLHSAKRRSSRCLNDFEWFVKIVQVSCLFGTSTTPEEFHSMFGLFPKHHHSVSVSSASVLVMNEPVLFTFAGKHQASDRQPAFNDDIRDLVFLFRICQCKLFPASDNREC